MFGSEENDLERGPEGEAGAGGAGAAEAEGRAEGEGGGLVRCAVNSVHPLMRSMNRNGLQRNLEHEHALVRAFVNNSIFRGFHCTVVFTDFIGKPRIISSCHEASSFMTADKYEYAQNLHSGETPLFPGQNTKHARLPDRLNILRKIVSDMEYVNGRPLPVDPTARTVSDMNLVEIETRLREYIAVGFFVSKPIVDYLQSLSAAIQEPLPIPGSRYFEAFTNSPGAVIPPFDQISPICWPLLDCNGCYDSNLAPKHIKCFRQMNRKRRNTGGRGDGVGGMGPRGGGGGVGGSRDKVSFVYIFALLKLNSFFRSFF